MAKLWKLTASHSHLPQPSYASHQWTSPGDEMNGHAFLGAPRLWSIIAVAFQRLCVAVRKVSDNTSFDNRSTSKGQTTALTKIYQVFAS